MGLVATEDTAQALTTMLQVNKALTHLDLSRNVEVSSQTQELTVSLKVFSTTPH